METTSAHRVIDGTLYARSAKPYAFDLRVHDLGHGHVEATALPRYAWGEVGALEGHALRDWQAFRTDFQGRLLDPPSLTKKELFDKAAANRKKVTQRARTRVRRLAKWKGLTVLLTLTYKENVIDRARMARDFDVFVKRVRRVVPSFEYVCVFECQERGAWHAHIAVPRILSHYMHKGALVRSYALLRSMWRGVVGEFEGKPGGNVDVSRNRRVNRSSAKLALYLSKYIGKDLGEGLAKWQNSYSASGRALPDAIHERVLTNDQTDALAGLIDLLLPEIATGWKGSSPSSAAD